MDRMDAYLEKRLKKVATMYPPPGDGRARLLEAARTDGRERSKTAVEANYYIFHGKHEGAHNNRWSLRSFDWFNVYTFQFGFSGMRLLL